LSFCFPTPELVIEFIQINWHEINFLKLREIFPQQSLISNIPAFIKAHELSRSFFFPDFIPCPAEVGRKRAGYITSNRSSNTFFIGEVDFEMPNTFTSLNII